MNEPETIASLLRECHNIAVVGLSAKPARASHGVASYLREQGYTVLPVNPTLTEWEGLPAYPSLAAIPADLGVDLVDVFRRPDQVAAVVEEVLALKAGKQRGLKGLWLQEGVIDAQAAARAEAAGLKVVMDRCLYKEHVRWKG